MSLRILCYNIHGGYDIRGRRDLVRLHDFMQRHDIDIGVFQEIETRPSRGGTLQDIHTIAGPSRPYHLPGLAMMEGEGWYGNLIVSRYPIERGLVHNLETSPHREPRNAVDALIAMNDGLVRLIGTHLSLSPIERWTEVRNLVRLIESVEETEMRPILLMGDINEWRGTSRLLKYLNERLMPVPCGKTFPSFMPLFRLDRVWGHNIRGNITARCLSDAKNLSDHLPILIEFN
jgi:endonuclease/exonuclease/phosphatase family metal-dependent hydrolase